MITTMADLSSRLALDAQSVDQLRFQARTDQLAGAKAAARQFEAMFLNMVLKSMREAVPKEGLFDNSTTELYTAMFDSQLSQSLSRGKGIGLADMMLRQMQRQGVIPPETARDKPVETMPQQLERRLAPAAPSVFHVPAVPVAVERSQSQVVPDDSRGTAPPPRDGFTDSADFVEALLPHAADASRLLGVPAQFLVGHAALESGWGRREIRDARGNNSFNLFGIKAGKGWHGAVVRALTTEYVNGVARKKTEVFRAYNSYAESFQDYAKLLKNNSRYAPLFTRPLDADGFARGLQQAGYATDPSYATKLARVINSGALRRAIS